MKTPKIDSICPSDFEILDSPLSCASLTWFVCWRTQKNMDQATMGFRKHIFFHTVLCICMDWRCEHTHSWLPGAQLTNISDWPVTILRSWWQLMFVIHNCDYQLQFLPSGVNTSAEKRYFLMTLAKAKFRKFRFVDFYFLFFRPRFKAVTVLYKKMHADLMWKYLTDEKKYMNKICWCSDFCSKCNWVIMW